jgi:hypothetical protein
MLAPWLGYPISYRDWFHLSGGPTVAQQSTIDTCFYFYIAVAIHVVYVPAPQNLEFAPHAHSRLIIWTPVDERDGEGGFGASRRCGSAGQSNHPVTMTTQTNDTRITDHGSHTTDV